GETTSFFLYKKLMGLGVKISTIARGVGFGDDLEYTDELTLGKSIENRNLFKL
ncbi:MAG: recombination protein RecR, partial [Bacteroidales bacterium]